MKKRMISWLLIFAILLQIMPMNVFASEGDRPFTSVQVNGQALAEDKIEYMGTYALDGTGSDYYDGTYYDNVPYYHVTVPEGTETADVVWSSDVDIYTFENNDGTLAVCGYNTRVGGGVNQQGMEFDAGTSASVKNSTTYGNCAVNEAGELVVTLNVTKYLVEEGVGLAYTPEDSNFAPVCLISFGYETTASEEELVVIPEGMNIKSITDAKQIIAGEEISFELWGTPGSAPSYIVSVPEGTTTVTVTFAEGADLPTPYGDANNLSGAVVNLADYSAGGTENPSVEVDGCLMIELDVAALIEKEQMYGVYTSSYTVNYFIGFEYVAGGTGGHTHEYTGEVVAPTCTEGGYTVYTCECGYSYTDNDTDSLGHKYAEWTVVTEPTCTEAGTKTRSCTREECDAVETGTIDKLGHDFEGAEWVVTKEATCTEKGIEVQKCQREGCEGTQSRDIEKADHTYENGVCTECGDELLTAPVQDENGVYQIGTVEELKWFAKHVNNEDQDNTATNAVLTADIDMADVEWAGIGTSAKSFAGTFDGQNHIVSNLNNGLFGYVKGTSNTNRAEIKNVIVTGKIEDAYRSGGIADNAVNTNIESCVNRIDISGSTEIAGIVGTFMKGNMKDSNVTISKCVNEGNITATESLAGGITSYARGGITITECANIGNITGTSGVNTQDGLGGIAGYMQGYPSACVIENCYNLGNVKGSSNDLAGGILGNAYNSITVKNCYSAGEVYYGIAGNVYNKTASITNCYYLTTKSYESVPYTDVFETQISGKTLAEMSDKNFVVELGEAYQLSCPAPVFTWQTAKDHVGMEDGVCDNCKYSEGPTMYKVTLPTSDLYTVEGSLEAEEGKPYTFTVTIAEGYQEGSSFAVRVNGQVMTKGEDGTYTYDNVAGPLNITVDGVEKVPESFTVTLPPTGNGYVVKSAEGYDTTVKYGKDYKFEVSFAHGFREGSKFKVLANNVELTKDEDGFYTIVNMRENMTIVVEGTELIPYEDTVNVEFTITYGEEKFYTAEETGTTFIMKELEIPYFDLSLYGMEEYYYNPDCYVAEAVHVAGNTETAYGNVTVIHAFIYATEILYLGMEEEDAGTGLSHKLGYINDQNSPEEILSWSGGVGSSFMDLWDHGTNLNYYVNYVYPLGLPGWGATSDQVALKDGDVISLHMIEDGQVSGSNFAAFTANDTDKAFSYEEDIVDSMTITQGDDLALTYYQTRNSGKYDTNYETVFGQQLYWIEEDYVSDNILGYYDEELDEVYDAWKCEGFADLTKEEFKTGKEGTIVIDTTKLEPGTYYIGTVGGITEGGAADNAGFVSRGNETGAAVFKLTVKENPNLEPEIVYGDLNGDGEVTAVDAAMAYSIVNSNMEPTEEQFAAADVNGDGEVTAVDAAMIYSYVNSNLAKFPVEE